MTTRLGLTFLLLLFSVALTAQKGDYYVTNHHVKLADGKVDDINFDVDITPEGLLAIGNRQGVVFYDGKTWDFYETPGAALSVASSKGQISYVGCVGDFGKIDLVDKAFKFISFSEKRFHGLSFFQTEVIGQSVYYLSDQDLIIRDINSGQLTSISSKQEDERFEYLFALEGKGVFLASNLTLYELKDGNLHPNTSLSWPSGEEVQFVTKSPFNDDYLFVSVSNQLFHYHDQSFRALDNIDLSIDSVSNVEVVQAEWINDHDFALSTLSNGVMMFNLSSQQLIGHLDYNTGLPDNEIYDMKRDLNGGLWIVHEYGLTRVCPDIPVKSFSNYPGLDGNLISAQNVGGKLYIGTSKGLYLFQEQKQYENIVYYVKAKDQQSSNDTRSNRKEEKSNVSGAQNEDQQKFRLFGKKDNTKRKSRRSKRQAAKKANQENTSVVTKVFRKITNTLVNVGEKIKKKDKANTVKYSRRIKKKLVDTFYEYTKISGLHSKTKQILSFRDQVLVAGNGGLYEINGLEAQVVIDAPIQYAQVLEHVDQLLVATSANELFLYDYEDSVWVITDSLFSPNNAILGMMQNGIEGVVMAGTTALYDININRHEYKDQSVEITNQHYDNIRLTRIADHIYLINEQGYYRYDTASRKVEEDFQLLEKLGKPVRHLQQTNGLVWVYDGKKWHRINSDASIETIDYFSLFPSMSFIDYFDDAFWIINKTSNELIRFDHEKAKNVNISSRMFFKSIKTPLGHIEPVDRLVFSHDNNSISFRLARPDYLGFLNVEYQYLMEGLDQQWSDWSSEGAFHFNYLRPNKYTMRVRSRDAFGNVQESEPVKFRIKPPYWQEPWFNMLQVFIFAILILLSSRLNRKGESKYIWLTRILTVLTIVLVIEFLQSTAQLYLSVQSTPVVEFLINVGVALLVFPIELLLKKILKTEI